MDTEVKKPLTHRQMGWYMKFNRRLLAVTGYCQAAGYHSHVNGDKVRRLEFEQKQREAEVVLANWLVGSPYPVEE